MKNISIKWNIYQLHEIYKSNKLNINQMNEIDKSIKRNIYQINLNKRSGNGFQWNQDKSLGIQANPTLKSC